MIGILDYGVCNVGSVRNMLQRSGFRARIITTPAEVAECGKLILPGIGHFGAAMAKLREASLIEPIREHAAARRKPLLGICLGMQLLGRWSEEGDCEGLGLVPASIKRFDVERMPAGMKIPHMGWAHVTPGYPSPFCKGLNEQTRFYFVHSLHAVIEGDALNPILWCDYGYRFVAAYAQGGIMGAQFHPEKSHAHGAKLLANFAQLP